MLCLLTSRSDSDVWRRASVWNVVLSVNDHLGPLSVVLTALSSRAWIGRMFDNTFPACVFIIIFYFL